MALVPRKLFPTSCRSIIRNRLFRHRSNIAFDSTQTNVNADVKTTRTNNSWDLLKRIDVGRLLDPQMKPIINENIKRRQCQVSLDKIAELAQALQSGSHPEVHVELVKELMKVPNDTHPESWKCSDAEVNIIRSEGVHEVPPHVKEFHAFCKPRDLVRTENLGNLAGHRAYYIKGPLAELEQALIRFTVKELLRRGFELISVPDVLYPEIIESMGMTVRGERDQVYFLETPENSEHEWCLSGTAEMALGGFIQNRVFRLEDLPTKFAAVSRCFRAETSSLEEESGLYRVHYFTKVEMFGVTANETGEESNELQLEFLRTQQELFSSLNLPYRTLEMPPYELGLSAYRKFDIEAWMPGKKMYGEISSCSNCTDFQSRRLNVRYITSDKGSEKFVHTVNGTACAAPRMLISMVENFQNPAGEIELPEALKSFMNRGWVNVNPTVQSNFLRTKSQMDRVTEEYD